MNPEIPDLLTSFFSGSFSRKFIIIRYDKIFSLSVTYFVIIICFFTILLPLGILFSTALRAAVAARPVILGILPPISVIFP